MGSHKSSGKTTWELRRNALNILEMRTVNSAGIAGQPSSIEMFWHYREPFKPRKKN